ncbi:hypothetical protein ACLGIH_22405 [Streptomyces sp. HMX87]|uniref:hypothetical protein n=1 Tax=Streptomyces sp. HMX87 TaxID=3390849 RepID=UPI003A86647C
MDVADASTLESIPAVSPVGLSDAVEGAAQKPTSLVADAGGKSAQTVLPEAGKAARLV